MKLYFSPGTCSLAPHIVMLEAGLDFDLVKVDLKGRCTEAGTPLSAVNGKEYVPVLELDDGLRITEGPVILQYLADLKPEAGLIAKAGTLERYRTLEWLNFVSSELHKTFYPLFRRDKTSADWQRSASNRLARRFDWVSEQVWGSRYVQGDHFNVADAYLFTVLNWTRYADLDLQGWPALAAYYDRVAARFKVREAMEVEGLTGSHPATPAPRSASVPYTA